MKALLATAAIAAVALTAAPALADPGHGHGHGHDQGYGHGPKGHPHGMPPGQAKKMWSRGQRLPAQYFAQPYYVTDYSRYDLPPPPPAYRYVYVEDRVYLVDPKTQIIRDVVSALLR